MSFDIRKKYNNIKLAVAQREGVDPEWDRECEEYFFKVLDMLHNFLIICFFGFGSISLYFLFV